MIAYQALAALAQVSAVEALVGMLAAEQHDLHVGLQPKKQELHVGQAVSATSKRELAHVRMQLPANL